MSTGDYYYLDQSRTPQGPVSLDGLRQLHAGGTVTSDTLIAQKGSQNWVPYAQHPDTSGPGQPSGTPPVPTGSVPPPTGMPPMPEGMPPQSTTSTGKVVMWVGLGCLLAILLAGGGCAAFIYAVFQTMNDEPAKQEIVIEATELMRANHPKVLDELGPPLKAGFMTTGHINYSSTMTYDGVMPIEGSKRNAILHFDAEKNSGGNWEFYQLDLQYGSDWIDLLEPGEEPEETDTSEGMLNADPPEADEPGEAEAEAEAAP